MIFLEFLEIDNNNREVFISKFGIEMYDTFCEMKNILRKRFYLDETYCYECHKPLGFHSVGSFNCPKYDYDTEGNKISLIKKTVT